MMQNMKDISLLLALRSMADSMNEPVYSAMTTDTMTSLKKKYMKEYDSFKCKNMKLDMSRGKPAADQLALSSGMLDVLSSEDYLSAAGLDCRNYGVLDGLPEVKALMGDLMGVPAENVIVGGNSSLNMMYDTVARAMLHGVYGSEKPWCRLDSVKFLCPVPGYDRHFAICQNFGIEMINVPMTEEGPDMDLVEKLVSEDESIKGIWCVPKFSNPTGITYSDETVRRFANLSPAAKDFRIFWDNAYLVHELYDESVSLLNIFDEAKKTGKEDMIFQFCSTSKISWSGAGLAAMACSFHNRENIRMHMTVQTIGTDKMNQLRHLRFFKDMDGIHEHMKKHAALIRPKFQMVESILEKELGYCGIASWTHPMGGYFISLTTQNGCAKRVIELCREAGVTMTPAGATHPYGIDPEDNTIRIAPTYASLEELEPAAHILSLCVKIATVEKMLSESEEDSGERLWAIAQ